MLNNIAEEVAGTELGVKVSCFRMRHHDRLSSLYLRIIDHQRKVTDNSKYFVILLRYGKIAFLVFSTVASWELLCVIKERGVGVY
jgi:hypothetical protein